MERQRSALDSTVQHSNAPMLHYSNSFSFYLIFIGRPLRRMTIKRFECLYLGRVLPPLAILPHGDVNCCQPPPDFDLPAPPPFGWSTGLRATPRLMPRMPRCRERPALPRITFSCSGLPTWPMVA